MSTEETVGNNEVVENTTQDENPATEENGRTFTQAELNAIVQKRVAKFSDYDEIKAQLEELKNSSEEAMGQAIENAREEARAEVLSTTKPLLVKAETKALAAEMGFIYPADAHLYIDAESVPLTDSGEPDVEKIKELLAEVAQERPALVRSAESTVTPIDAGIGVAGAAPKKSTAQLFADALTK